MSTTMTKEELSMKLQRVAKEKEKLEKALDRACEKLEYCSKERGIFNVRCNRSYWKNRFLKEVEYD